MTLLNGEVHGDELDAAMKRAVDPMLLMTDFGICGTALQNRVHTHIDEQLANAADLEGARQALVAAGDEDPSDELVAAISLRGVIGGSFTFGLATGLELARAALEGR